MYIWAAIYVEDQLLPIKEKALAIQNNVSFESSSIESLPLHISLKISCLIDNSLKDQAISDLEAIFKSYKPFFVKPSRIELHDTICWVLMENNESLENLHKDICDLFKDKYGTTLDKYDLGFIYHTTLFLDSDSAKVKEAFLQIKDEKLPEVLHADKVIIGGSETGEIGTYNVFKIIDL